MGTRTMHSGGTGHDIVRIYSLDGDKWKIRANGYKTRRGGCGFGINETNTSYTLNATDKHIIARIEEGKEKK